MGASKLKYKVDSAKDIALTEDSYVTIYSVSAQYGLLHEFQIQLSNNDCDLRITFDSDLMLDGFNCKDYSAFAGDGLTTFKLDNSAKVVTFNPAIPIDFRSEFKIEVQAKKNNRKASYIVVRSE